MFRSLNQLVEAGCAMGPARIAVAAGQSRECLEALKQAREIGLADGIFVGDAKQIWALADEIGFDLPAHQVLNEPDTAKACHLAVGMVRDGNASLIMKGKVGTKLNAREFRQACREYA